MQRLSVLTVTALACAAMAQPPASQPTPHREVQPGADALTIVTLSTGDALHVRAAAWYGDELLCTHPVLGELRVPRSSVKSIDVPAAITPASTPPTEVDSARTPPDAAPQPDTPANPRPAPAPAVADTPSLPEPEPWKWSLSSGLTGSEGNTEQSAFRIDFRGERRTDRVETDLTANYRYAEDDGEASANRAELTGTRNWLFPPSRWGAFSRGRLEYDQFQEWRWRASAFAGPSYTWLKAPPTLVRTRAGLGGSYEWGGQNNGFEPEGLIGLDLEHEINDRQKVTARIDYLPSLDSFPAYRIDSEAAWEIKIDPEYNLFLKIGIADRYDSTPGDDRRRNDLEYFLNLGVEF